MNTPNRLVRASDDRYIAGVCGGLARYFGLDPMLVRGAFVVLVFFGGLSLVLYPLLWLLTPLDGSTVTAQETVKQNAQEMKAEAERLVERMGLRQRRVQDPGWRYDPYTGQPIAPPPADQQNQNGGTV